MLAEEALLTGPMGHSMSGLSGSLPPPTHQQLPPSLPSGLNKTRTELHDIPTKKVKPLDDASVYPMDYQRYHTLMYAHCAQQQHVGQMSAFRPWAPPKSFLHAYNAAAVAALCLSQEPPILQNPERVVRNSDRERFERTYQPNVALAPRKNITPKEMDRERERERERERIEREREREIERARERERSRERERARERENEKERERELQQLQQHTQRHEGFSNLRDTDMQVHIKQERANTPCNMSPVTPPLPNIQIMSQIDEQHLNLHHRRSIGPMSNEDETQPLSLSLYHQNRHTQPAPLQQHPLALKSNNNNNNGTMEILQQRRSSLQTSSSSTCSTTSSVSSISPPECHQQQQLLGLYHNFHQQQQHQQQQHQHQLLQTHQPRQSPHSISPPTLSKHNNHFSPPQQQHQQINHVSHNLDELSSSNEISSSTSPLPPTSSTHNTEDKQLQHHQLQTQHQYETQQLQTQTMINTVNQHTKLLPTITNSTAVTSNNNNNSNNIKHYDEISNSRIRINKNLMHQSNIMRTPTPPPKTPKSPAALQLIPQQQQQQQQQQYDYGKQQKQSCYINFTQPQQQQQIQPQQSQQSYTAGLNLSTNKKNNNPNSFMNKYSYQQQQQQKHNGIAPTRSHYHHQHMGSGEFELSTDTDDESLNGEPDSSINVLPPWEMAVEALRETKPKERERVLHLLQRLLHDNQQYRYTNLKLNELLQKRETQIRELSEQLQHYRFMLEQQQQKHQTRLIEQEEPENLKSRVQDEKFVSNKNEELCVPLKKSLRREPELLMMDAITLSRNNNTIETKRKIKEETRETELEVIERKKTKSEEILNGQNIDEGQEKCFNDIETKLSISHQSKLENNNAELDVKPKDIEVIEKVESSKKDSHNIDNDDHTPDDSAKESMQAENDTDTDSENESDKSNQSTVTSRAKKSNVTAQVNAKDGTIEVDLDYEIKNNVLLKENEIETVQNTEISLCTNENISQETECSDNNDDEDVGMVDEEDVEKEKEDKNATVRALLPLTPSPSAATPDLPGQLFDNTNSSESVTVKDVQMEACNVVTKRDDATYVGENEKGEAKVETASSVANNVSMTPTTKTIKDDALCKTVDKTEKKSKETTYMLAKKKKKKKERKERKEKRRAAAALALAVAATATAVDVVSTSTYEEVQHNEVISNQITGSILRPPMVTKASKKQTPLTTNCELQQPQQQTIKQE